MKEVQNLLLDREVKIDRFVTGVRMLWLVMPINLYFWYFIISRIIQCSWRLYLLFRY